MPKLIDAEAAKAAIEKLIEATQATRRLAIEAGFREAASGAGYCYGALKEVLSALDALPDASKPAIHAERIPVPPHLAEAQRVVIRQAQQAGDGAEEET